jgi:arylsulfatase
MMQRRVALPVVGVLLAFAFVTANAVLGTSVALPPPAPAPAHPDILLVTIDALRADHLSSYGYDRFTSPAIDRFARGATRFSNAIAQAPYTKASVASIMTGQYPTAHQTITASVPFAETMTGHPTSAAITTDVLPSSMPTLAERLRAAGYHTAGFTANPFLIEPFGFARGFDVFRFYPGPDFAHGDQLVADALDAARATDRRRPLFTWVHLMEPHSPYTPPPLTAGMFAVSGPPQPIASAIEIPTWLLPDSPRDRRPYVAAYDDEIAAADAAFGTLLRQLRATRAGHDTLVVLTADHGEQFLDHGGWEHGSNLHDELIRVPLIIQWPTSRAARNDVPVQLIDLFATLLESAGVRVGATPGRNLADPAVHAGRSLAALSEIVGAQSALRDRGFKLIVLTGGAVQLFDVVRDPHELHDIAAADPARVARMRETLDHMQAEALQSRRGARVDTVPVDRAVADRIRALGYVQH